MKEFMLLMQGDNSHEASPEEMQQRMQDYMGWMQGMMESGKLKTGQPLEPAGRLLKNRETILTDGPFLEPKEIIGGYVIVLANDLEEATQEALNCPLLDHCEIMVRPVMNIPG